MDVSSLHSMLPEGEPVPVWVQLIPGGSFSGRDGRGPYRMADAHAVAAASLKPGDKLTFDQDHATDHSLRTGTPAPARGWIVEMQARDGALWGRVEWTAAGKGLLERKEYRGVSPVFQHDADGGVTRVLRASLTNAPNLDLPTLHHQQGTTMDLTAQLRTALGLPEAADEAAILAAVTANCTAVSAHAQLMASVATAVGLAADAKPEAIVTAIQVSGASKGDLKEVVALQSRIHELEQSEKRGSAERAINAAMAAGKPIPASRREDFIARHMADPTGTAAWLDDMPSINAGGLGQRAHAPAASDPAGLTPADHEVIALMGLDPKEFAKQKVMIATGVAA